MELHTFYLCVLVLSLSMLCSQLLVKHKRVAHLLFAIFCGSIAVVVAQQLTANTLGPYSHLVSLGTCATCNIYWLLARALFRNKKALNRSHIGIAASLSVLFIANELLSFYEGLTATTFVFSVLAHTTLGEMINLLSSALLLLALWEPISGYNKVNRYEKIQRQLLILAFGSALFVGTLAEGNLTLKPWVLAISIAQILIATQIIIFLKYHHSLIAKYVKHYFKRENHENHFIIDHDTHTKKSIDGDNEDELARDIFKVLSEEQAYLRANLKLVDIAQIFEVPEYKVSRVIKHHFDAQNFNQCINRLRIEHATRLFEDSDYDCYPIFSIALESGFSSAAPFTRAFKSLHKCTPFEYRTKVKKGRTSGNVILSDG